MPWSWTDAEEHKKGLTDAQKKKWARIANSALASCQADGGDDCEGRAIRIANAKADEPETQAEIIGNMSELVHWELLDQTSYCVVPVIMAVEGVMNGLLYPAEELSKFPNAWNGRPVPVLHPRKDGKNISANTPEQDAKSTPGKIWNTRFEDNKLKADIFIDPTKADKVNPEIMQKLRDNETMEVSTGLYIEIEETEGEFNGTSYKGIARNHRPDHLALLPDGGAACSWEDGAGMPRVNKKDEGATNGEESPSLLRRAARWLVDKFRTHELNHDEIDRRLRDAVRAKLNLDPNEWVWMKEVFDNYCIYEHDDNQGVTRLYKQSYVIDDQDHVLLADEAQEVKEVTSYPLVSPEANLSSNKGDSPMDDKEKKEQVEALIANEKSDYTEEDRKELEALSEKTLTNLVGVLAANAEEEKKKEEEEAAKKKKEEEDAAAAGNKAEGEEDAPQALSQEQVENMIDKRVKERLAATTKKPILERLEANEKCKLSKEALATLSQEDLEALEQSLNPGDYSGKGGPRDNDEDGAIPPTPEFNWDEYRKEHGIKA